MRTVPSISIGVLFHLVLAPAAIAAPFAYVPNSGTGSVSVINTSSDAVIATVPVASFVQGAAVTPDGLRVYISTIAQQKIFVLDALSNTISANISLTSPIPPVDVAISPDGSRAYATTTGVSVIDTASN